MLKKNNKILIGSLVFLLVLSVGYALFSDTITINGTATAKGNFDYEIVCTPGISEELYSGDIDHSKYYYVSGNNTLNSTTQNALLNDYPEGGYSEDKCEISNNNVSFSTNLIAPGSTRYFTVKMTNIGSIPIEFGTRTENIDINVKVTSHYGDVVNLTKSDFLKPREFAWVAGEAVDIKDLTSMVMKSGDSAYLLIAISYPEKLLLNRKGDLGNGSSGYYDVTSFYPGNGSTKAIDLSINYTLNIPIQQITVQ